MKKLTLYLEIGAMLLVLFILLISLVGRDRGTYPSADTRESGGTENIAAEGGPLVGNPSARILEQAPYSTGPEEETVVPEDAWSRKKWLGDYPAMVKRRMIRALVPPSKTFFFLDKPAWLDQIFNVTATTKDENSPKQRTSWAIFG